MSSTSRRTVGPHHGEMPVFRARCGQSRPRLSLAAAHRRRMLFRAAIPASRHGLGGQRVVSLVGLRRASANHRPAIALAKTKLRMPAAQRWRERRRAFDIARSHPVAAPDFGAEMDETASAASERGSCKIDRLAPSHRRRTQHRARAPRPPRGSGWTSAHDD